MASFPTSAVACRCKPLPPEKTNYRETAPLPRERFSPQVWSSRTVRIMTANYSAFAAVCPDLLAAIHQWLLSHYRMSPLCPERPVGSRCVRRQQTEHSGRSGLQSAGKSSALQTYSTCQMSDRFAVVNRRSFAFHCVVATQFRPPRLAA